jgi:hypothetical protein
MTAPKAPFRTALPRGCLRVSLRRSEVTLPKRYGEKLSVVLDNTLERQFEDEVRIGFGLSSPTG